MAMLVDIPEPDTPVGVETPEPVAAGAGIAGQAGAGDGIAISHLSKEFRIGRSGVLALDDANLETDAGSFVALADDVAGLEVFRDRLWHPVRTPRGSFVCNIGDMLARWTNDRWTSTLHRVVPPRAETAGATSRGK
jgi:2-oxoglutarate-Fe(II)-dependent oxygenase superfamily protein